MSGSSVDRPRQIFGMGGGFYPEPWNPPILQKHLMTLSQKAEPRICLLATATGDNPADIEMFYRHMSQLRCRPTHLSLMAPSTMDFAQFFKELDIVYVGGGATKNLMAMWRDWGVDHALRSAWEEGVILSGTSAGSICWFESCITDSFPPKMLPLKCTGFLKGSASTHYSSRPDRAGAFRELIATGVIEGPGIATDDGVGLHYIGDKLHEVVSIDEKAMAYIVTRTPEGYDETPLKARLIA